MPTTIQRLTQSSLLTVSSILTLGLVQPVMPTPNWLTPAPALAAEQTDLSAGEIYRQSVESVVMLYTLNSNFEVTGNFGSGFMVNAEGLIVTNAHVVDGGITAILVIFSDGSKTIGEVVGLDRQGRDLAAVKLVDASNNRPSLALATHRVPTIGDTVYAIGAPRGIANTMTSGIVGNLAADNSEILHNAAINGGNSGGPLLNAQGQVIGMNTRIYRAAVEAVGGEVIGGVNGYSGMSFAIATSHIEEFIADVRAGIAITPNQTTQQLAQN